MVNEVDISLGSWCFGNTRYRSGEGKEAQYVLRVTDQTMTIRRKTEPLFPGLFVVISRGNVSGGQVDVLSRAIARVLTVEP